MRSPSPIKHNPTHQRPLLRWIQGLVLMLGLITGLLGCGALPCDDDNECPDSICHPVQKVCLGKGMRCVPGNKQACVPAGQTLQSKGECKPGNQTCTQAGTWGSCLGAIIPTTEVCDRKDNDCDGQIDEGCAVKAFCESLQLNDLLTARALFVPQKPDTRQLELTLSKESQALWTQSPTLSFVPASWRASSTKLSPSQAPRTLTLTLTAKAPIPSKLQVSVQGALLFPDKDNARCDVAWSSGALSFACPDALLLCQTGCIDPDTNATHCGKCNNACKSSERCEKGSCIPVTCEQKKTICDNKCVDTKVEAAHCGKCGNVCPKEKICREGQCRFALPACPGTETRCGERCVDLQCEIAHCGRCGNQCKPGQACEKGACVPCQDCPLWGLLAEVHLNHVAIDAKRNIYIAGHYTKASQLGSVALKPVGAQELVIAKLSPEGKWLWVRTAPTLATGSIVAKGFAVSDAGDVYIGGSFTEGVSFGQAQFKSKGERDAFLTSLDTRGKWGWSKTWGTALNDAVTRIDAAPADAVVAAIETRGDITIEGKKITHRGDAKDPRYSIFQLGSSGTMQWLFHFSRGRISEMNGLRYDSFGNVYIAAQFRELVGFGSTGLITYTHDATLLAKLSPSGTPIWARQFGNAATTSPRHLLLDSLNNPVIVGTFDAYLSIGTQGARPRGEKDIFVCKWSSKGALMWLTSAGGPRVDEAYQLAIDRQDRIYFTGAYRETLHLGEMRLFTKQPLPQGFLAQLDSSGRWIGVMELRSSGESHARAITSNSLDQLYLTGTFEAKDLALRKVKFRAAAERGNGILLKFEKPGLLCAEDNQICGNTCAMTAFSQAHCGACNKACPTSEVCERGRCVPCSGCSAWLALAGTNATLQGSADTRGVARDSKDNVYIVGTFTKTINFDSIQLTATGSTGAFIAKLNNAGNWLWAKALNSSGRDRAFAVAVDVKDQVYWGGDYGGATTFDGKSLPGKNALFVMKMTPAGALTWATTIATEQTPSHNLIIDLTTDKLGNVYATGRHSNGTKFGKTTLAAPTQSTRYDGFLAKLDNKGQWLWATRLGTLQLAQGHKVRLDPQGNIYWLGLLRGGATYGNTNIRGGSVWDPFIAKADSKGKPLWIKRAGNVLSDDRGEGLAVDASGVYITGHFNGEADFGANKRIPIGRSDIFVAKLDHQGTWKWVHRYGSQQFDYARAIHFNSKGELLVSGEFLGTGNFGRMLLGQYGVRSIYVLHMDTNGQLLGGFSGGGPAEDVTFAGTVVDGQDRIIIAGHTKSHQLYFGTKLHRRRSPLAPVPFVAKLATTRPCPPNDHAICGRICVHLKTDFKNCGACGKACTLGQACRAGVCQ